MGGVWSACSAPHEAPAELQWFAGDMHVHATGGSNDTDDLSDPAAIAGVARDRDLDFIVLTDHSNATGSMHCEDDGGDVEDCPNLGPEFPHADAAAALSDASLLMVVGNEISPIFSLDGPGPPVGHVGCLPPSQGSFAWEGAFTDRPAGAITSADAVHQCRAVGGLAILNHPFAFARWIQADWTTMDVDGVEVWNGGAGWDAWDRRSLRAWECLAIRALAEDRSPPVPIAASDVHRVHTPEDSESLTDPPLGRPRTSIQATSLRWRDLHAALANGGPVVLHEDDTWLTSEGGRTPTAGRVEVRRLLALQTTCDPSDPLGAWLHEVTESQPVEGDFELALSLPSEPYYLALTRDDLPEIQGGDVALTGVYLP